MVRQETTQQVLDAIADGHQTKSDISDATGLSATATWKALTELHDDGTLDRDTSGRVHIYTAADGLATQTITDAPDDVAGQTVTEPVAPVEPDEPTQPQPTADTTGGGQTVTIDVADLAREAGEDLPETDGSMVVNRDYDWDDDLPDVDSVTPFVPTGPELDELVAQVALRDEFDHRVVALLIGPTASGKTTLAENIAAGIAGTNVSETVSDALGDRLSTDPMPYFEVQVHDQLMPSELFGSPTIVGGDTMWEDGPITKALLASKDRPVVLVLDEITRAPPQAKSALFDLLDHRVRVKLEGGRGGEPISGNPQNLIVVATANRGPGHYVEPMDIAEERRWKAAWEVDYLYTVDAGPGDETPAQDMLESATDVPAPLAERMVSVAAELADLATDDSSRVQKKPPMGSLTQWARVATMNAAAGIENPVSRAGQSTIVNVFYSEPGRGDVTDEVTALISGEFDGLNATDEQSVAAFYGDPLADDDADDSDDDSIGDLFN